MPEYHCECCKFSSSLKSNYLRHLKTNKHQKKIKSHPKVTKKSPLLYPKVTISEDDGISHLKCKYCNKQSPNCCFREERFTYL